MQGGQATLAGKAQAERGSSPGNVAGDAHLREQESQAAFQGWQCHRPLLRTMWRLATGLLGWLQQGV